MKIEKISDKQIRCTLTSADLAERQLRLSELAYGTTKAQTLFREMMREAYRLYGFSADNIPLMIEAVPNSADSIVLLITKTEDPDELDTRFSKFTQTPAEQPPKEESSVWKADDVLESIHKIYEAKKGTGAKRVGAKSEGIKARVAKAEQVDLVRSFSFPTIDDVIRAAAALGSFYHGANTLFKLRKDDSYLLVVHQSGMSAEDFNRVCNILTEYSEPIPYSSAKEAHMAEHETTIIKGSALQQLRKLN